MKIVAIYEILIDHVEIISLPKSSTFDKLNFYYEVLKSQKFDHISWVVAYKFSLYMGHRLCESQSYWSMVQVLLWIP